MVGGPGWSMVVSEGSKIKIAKKMAKEVVLVECRNSFSWLKDDHSEDLERDVEPR